MMNLLGRFMIVHSKELCIFEKKMNVFETSSGSKKIGVAPRYSGSDRG